MARSGMPDATGGKWKYGRIKGFLALSEDAYKVRNWDLDSTIQIQDKGTSERVAYWLKESFVVIHGTSCWQFTR